MRAVSSVRAAHRSNSRLLRLAEEPEAQRHRKCVRPSSLGASYARRMALGRKKHDRFHSLTNKLSKSITIMLAREVDVLSFLIYVQYLNFSIKACSQVREEGRQAAWMQTSSRPSILPLLPVPQATSTRSVVTSVCRRSFARVCCVDSLSRETRVPVLFAFDFRFGPSRDLTI